MSTIVRYNGVNPFVDQPTPFVTRSQEVIHYGKRWGQATSLSLNGQIIGPSYLGLISIKNQITSALFSQFKTLEIEEDSLQIFSLGNCRVNSINFSESKMAHVVEYDITIVGHDSSLFSGVYGVLNPQESFNFTDNGDGTVSMSHSLSAQGFNTTSSNTNAFQNAKNYVSSLAGWNNQITPYFTNGGMVPSPILISQTEKIDRLKATYAIDENYSFNTGTALTPLSTVSVSVQSGIEEDFATVSLSIDLKGGKTFSLDGLRNYASGIDLHGLAEANSLVFDLDTSPVSYSVSEDGAANTISVQVNFDNNKLFDGQVAYFDYTVSFETDEISKITTANLQGEIIGRGHLPYKLANAESFLDSTVLQSAASYLYSKANEAYVALGFGYNLSQRQKSFSVDKNTFDGSIKVSVSYTDIQLITEEDPTFSLEDLNYEVKIKPSLQTFKPFKSLNHNGYYLIYDMNSRSREKIDFTIGASHINLYSGPFGAANLEEFLQASSNKGKGYIYDLLDNLKGAYLIGNERRIESESLDIEARKGKISASYGFSQEEFHPTFTDGESKITVP